MEAININRENVRESETAAWNPVKMEQLTIVEALVGFTNVTVDASSTSYSTWRSM